MNYSQAPVRTKKINLENIKKKPEFLRMSKEDRDTLWYIVQRRDKMDEERHKHEWKRDHFDKQFNHVPNVKNNGGAGTSVPFEQLLIETYLWTLPEWLPVAVKAKYWKIDWKQLLVAKHVLDHFMDRENSIVEVDIREKKKARYWTWWLWSGMRFESFQKWTKIHTDWHIWVRWDIDIRKVWIDETAKTYWKAMDQILQEDISIEEFELRYAWAKWYKYTKSVQARGSKDSQEAYWDERNDNRTVKLRHYRNRLSNKYAIVANESILIYNWEMEEVHWWLPLIPVQHYPNSESIYGIWIPERYAFAKPYINQMLNYWLDGTKLNAWYAVFTGNDGEIDGEFYIEPWTWTIIEYSWDARWVVPFQPNVNVAQITQILEVMENFWTQALGFDARGSYQAQSDKVWIVAVLKEEQSQRARPVARWRNLWLWHAFTIMLINLAKFAPYKYAELVFNEETWDLEDYNWYQLEVENKKIKYAKDWKVLDIEDAPWESDYITLVDSQVISEEEKSEMKKKYWNFFDLSDTLLRWWVWLKVEIETPSNISTMKSLDKIDVQEAINIIMQQIDPNNPDPKKVELLDKLNDRLLELSWVDVDNISIKSKAEETKEYIAQAENIVANFGNPLSLDRNATLTNPKGVQPSEGASQLQGGAWKAQPSPA